MDNQVAPEQISPEQISPEQVAPEQISPEPPIAPTRARIGLALGAGGSAGSAFIATALALLAEQTGFDATGSTRIVGTSAGAFRAARVNASATPPTDIVVGQLLALANNDEWTATYLATAVRPLRTIGGRLVALLAPTTGHEPTWSVAPPPFHDGAAVVTVELRSGRRRMHPLAHIAEPALAVLASGAVPGVTKPVRLDGRRHIDGAVHSPTNVDLLPPDDLDLLIVIAPMVPRDGGNVLGRIHRSLLRHELRAWQQVKRPLIVIAPGSDDHRNRKDSERFGAAAATAITRLRGRRQLRTPAPHA